MIRRMTCVMATDVMEPTIQMGQRIVVDTRAYDKAAPQRWDVVTFWAPEIEGLGDKLGKEELSAAEFGQIATAAADIFKRDGVLQRPHIFFVKRVVGVQGDSLRFDGDRIMNGSREMRIPSDLQPIYRGFLEHESERLEDREWIVPDYHMFVVADNLRRGRDSRQIGPVHFDTLIGRVVA